MRASNSIFKNLKQKILLKLIIGVMAFAIVPILFLSCGVVLITGLVGEDDIAIAKSIEIPGEFLILAKNIADQEGADFIKLLVVSAMEAEMKSENYNYETLQKALNRIDDPLDTDSDIELLYEIYKKSYSTIETGPIPRSIDIVASDDTDDEEKIQVVKEYWEYSNFDDFGNERYYEGERVHYGNDLIADRYTPIVSMTDGVITNLGWNELGGWRIGITDSNGTYWYYAHMQHYEDGIYQGMDINAGDLIGYVGDSGYGTVGTCGKFITHLHLQIGIKLEDYETEDGYIWINPYPITIFTEPLRVELDKNGEVKQ